MPQSKSKYQFYQEASLSQKLADKIPLYQQLAGSDPAISESIGVLLYIDDPENMKLLSENPLKWIVGLLNVIRQARFATSEKVNEISKMGMQMPKAEDEFAGTGDTD